MTTGTNPFTSASISGYNSSPPDDDGSQTSANRVSWSKHKTKLADPIKTLAESDISNTSAAFAKTINTDDGVKNLLDGSLAFGADELTISSGSVTADRSAHTIDTESDAATDDLSNIVGTSVYTGAILHLYAANSARVVTVKNEATGAGEIHTKTGRDVRLSDEFPMVLRYNGTDWYEVSRPQDGPIGHIGGLGTSNGTDSDHDIDIAVGSCRADDDGDDIEVAAAITIAIDAAAGINSIDAGSVAANTTYAIWLLKGTSGVGAVFSTNFSTPTQPSGYSDSKRLIAAVTTDSSSNIIGYTQVGDYFRYTGDVIEDVNDSTITNDTFEVGTLSVPPSSLAHIYGYLVNTTATQTYMELYIRTNGAADDAATGIEMFIGGQLTADPPDVLAKEGTVLVDGSSQVQYTASEDTGASTVRIRTLGFTMLTRSNP